MSGARRRTGEGDNYPTKLPGPEDDATPFVVRCYVKSGAFRPLYDFEQSRRPLYDEYKVYAWRSATLRTIANLLYACNTSLSSAMTLHNFRVVRFDAERGEYTARHAGAGVTRLSQSAYADAIKELSKKAGWIGGAKGNGFAALADGGTSFVSIVEDGRPHFPIEADEDAASISLDSLHWQEGDLLDCATHELPAINTHHHIRGSGHRLSSDDAGIQPLHASPHDVDRRFERMAPNVHPRQEVGEGRRSGRAGRYDWA